MRWFLLALVLTGCTDPGDPPGSCDPDVALSGLPGSQVQLPFELAGGASTELCVVLDARANDQAVTFRASDPFFPSATRLELYDLDGVLLETEDEVGMLRWTMPAGIRAHVWLEVTASQGVTSVSSDVTLALSELR